MYTSNYKPKNYTNNWVPPTYPPHLSNIDTISYKLLDQCSRGVLNLANLNIFSSYCSLLKNGLSYKGKIVEIKSLRIGCSNSCLEGDLSITQFFPTKSSAATTCKFTISLSNNSPQLYADFNATPLTVSYSDFTNLGGDGAKSPLSELVITKSGIKDFSLQVNSIGICANPASIYFDGVATIDRFSLNFGVFINFKDSQLGFMFIFSTAFLNTIQDKVLGNAAPYLTLFEFTTCEFSIALPIESEIELPSPMAWPSGEPEIPAGISITLRAVIVQNSNNPVIKFLQFIFKSQEFTCSISIALTDVTIGFGLKQITLTSKVTLEQPGMIILADLDAGTVEANLLLNFHYIGNQNDVIFYSSCAITLGSANALSLSFGMSGTWNRPFGLNGVSISDVGGNIGVSPAPPFITEIGLRGTLQIKNIINGTIDINLDLNEYENDYFYCSMQGLTVGNLLEVIGVTLPGLPSIISESGYQFFMGSFAFNEIILDSGIKIPQGFRAAGIVNFLGLVAFADTIINLNYFSCIIKLPRINLLKGSIIIQESKDSTFGPYCSLYTSISTASPTLILSGSAFFKVPLFEVNCKFFIAPGLFTFQTSVIIASFSCDVSASVSLIENNYGGSFKAVLKDGNFFKSLTQQFLAILSQIEFDFPFIVSIEDILNDVVDVVHSFVDGITISFEASLSLTNAYFEFTISTIDNTVVKFTCGLNLNEFLDNMGKLIIAFVNYIKNYVTKYINGQFIAVGKVFKLMYTETIDSVTGLMTTTKKVVSKIVNKSREVIYKVSKVAEQATEFENILKGKFDPEKLIKLNNRIADVTKKALDDNIRKNIDEGVNIAIKEVGKTFNNAIKESGQGLDIAVSETERVLDNAINTVGNTMSGVVQDAKNGLVTAAKKTDSAFKKLGSILRKCC